MKNQITELIEDIYEVSSGTPGPTFWLTGGTHGNELAGIQVVDRLLEEFRSGKRELQKGTLLIGHGNPAAIAQNVRYTEADLNRSYHEKIINGDTDLYEHRRARALAPLLARADYALDLHATNKPSIPFSIQGAGRLADAAPMLDYLDSTILIDPEYVLDGDPATIDEYVDKTGGIGAGYETGIATDTTVVDEVYQKVLCILSGLGMIDPIDTCTMYTDKTVYTLKIAIDLTKEGFTFAPGYGEGSFEPFQAGDTIGYIGETPVTAEFDGVTLFPKLPEHQKLGKPVVYLAKRISS